MFYRMNIICPFRTWPYSCIYLWYKVSRTFLRILAVLNNAVVWIVSTRPLTSKSSSPFNNPFVIVPKAPITFGIIVTFMFHSFSNTLASLRYLSYFSLSLVLLLLFTHWEFFTPVLADGLSQEFEWQQVSSNLQDSFQYSVCSQLCCSLDGVHSSSYLPRRLGL